jgi:phosphoglycolate phosphatase-like HAD superfamily hydrolase
VTAVALELDGVLGDTRALWHAWLADTARLFDAEGLPDDRAAAAAELDRRGAGNWRVLLGRFASDRAPVFLRPTADVSATLRRLDAAGIRLGVFTDAPRELAEVALAHFGAGRRVTALETGAGALERLVQTLGPGTIVVRTRSELAAIGG